MARINYRALRDEYQARGPDETTALLRESLEKGHIKAEDFSFREAAEWFIPDGREFVRLLAPGAGGGINLLEAGHAVDTSAFANISGQIVFSKVKEGYEGPEFMWPQLCETVPTQFNGEKIPGIGGLADIAEAIDEGQPYPLAGLAEEWIETPETTKRGFIVPVTKEAIFFDRTNAVLKEASRVGYWLGVNKEKRVVDVATGQTNNWNYKGTAYNTFAASAGHGWVNQLTDVLSDYTDIEAAELLFDAMTDKITAEPLLRTANTLIVPTALKHTAFKLLNATELRHTPDPATNTADNVQLSASPIAGLYQMLTGQMIKARTSSATAWFLGNPKKAFAYMENFALTTQQAASNSEADFTQDIVMRYKCSERGVACVLDPTWMVYSTGGG